MITKHFTEKQIRFGLTQAEMGSLVADVSFMDLPDLCFDELFGREYGRGQGYATSGSNTILSERRC
jgi:hypothetical protein